MSLFKKAERKRVKLKIAVSGPSGSGKTYSALAIASGLGKKIALADTENGSASLYADKFAFDSFDIMPPYTTDKFISAITAAQKESYDVLVIDSISHQWSGQGGLLQQKEDIDSRGKGNGFVNWKTITPQHEQFRAHILHSDIHVICTMRSKQEYAQTEIDGKKSIKRIGLAPQQRDGMEYEFTLCLDLSVDHKAEVTKDRTGLLDGKTFLPTSETGRLLLDWVSTARFSVTGALAEQLADTSRKSNWVKQDVLDHMGKVHSATKFSDLSEDQYYELLTYIETNPKDPVAR